VFYCEVNRLLYFDKEIDSRCVDLQALLITGELMSDRKIARVHSQHHLRIWNILASSADV
jgi:hypothetical protein